MRLDKRHGPSEALGLYLHIPFCQERCHYCDFLTFPHIERYHEPYVQALLKEIALVGQGQRVDSIYIGGGTPSLLGKDQFDRIFQALLTHFSWQGGEWTLEANPGSLTKDKLEALAQAGVNRLSLGVQTMSDALLQVCGRTHQAQTVETDLKRIRAVAPFDLNLDFIFAIPGQKLSDIDRDLAAIERFQPGHISWYNLILEERTLFSYWLAKGRIQEASEDEELALMERAYQGLEDLGYQRYEISNFARPGKASRHNLKYWTGRDYLGLGLGAASYVDHKRFHNTSHFFTYLHDLDQGLLPRIWEQRSREEDLFEALMMGFRKLDGIDRRDFLARFGEDPMQRAPQFFESERRAGRLAWTDRRVYLTTTGLQLQNVFLLGLLDFYSSSSQSPREDLFS